MSRDIFKNLALRQIQGLMFHSDMADYYAFLNLKDFSKFHSCQYIKESETFREIKKYFIEHCHQTLRLGPIEQTLKVTPPEWDNKTSMDIDKETLRTLTKKSLEMYLKWETETEAFFHEQANALFDMGYYEDYYFVRHLADDVCVEKNHVTALILDLQSVNYDIDAIKGFAYKLAY